MKQRACNKMSAIKKAPESGASMFSLTLWQDLPGGQPFLLSFFCTGAGGILVLLLLLQLFFD
jgi:hypothetical protein